MTVIFCDVVGSTSLSQKLDPEDYHEVINSYQDFCAKIIHRHNGHIAQYLGDGILVYFGYPKAHEDDAQRAVRAGLDIVSSIQQLMLETVDLHNPLQVRAGVHTGLVMLGEIGKGEKIEQIALGETVNIAARIQEVAGPNQLVISGTTHRLIQGFFECQELGLRNLKGIEKPMLSYRVQGEIEIPSRFDVVVKRGLTPLIGRDDELEILLECWKKVKAEEGCFVLLSGEAGIGKSRLLRDFKDKLENESFVGLECQCSPYYQNSALYPVIDLIEKNLEFEKDETTASKVNKVETFLELHGSDPKESMPLLTSLLSLPLPDKYSPLELSPQKQRERIFQLLLELLEKMAETKPVLFVVEDLHWVDHSTIEFLILLSSQLVKVRILTVLSYRPEYTLPWSDFPNLHRIVLNTLKQSEIEKVVENIAREKALPNKLLQEIATKSDGIPLFAEELTKMVIESGIISNGEDDKALKDFKQLLNIPTTLRDSLMARLDRLATGKEVAQLGAAIGRNFSYELLRNVSLLDEAQLQTELCGLVDAELLHQSDAPPRSSYEFRHALIQEAAYESILKRKRKNYHMQIGKVLEEKFERIVETQPELLAYQFTEAGLLKKAIPYWQKSGQRSIEKAAYVEGITQLNKALELLSDMPDSPEKLMFEIGLQIALGTAYVDIKGYAAPEAMNSYKRAHELGEKVGTNPNLFFVLLGLWGFYGFSGDLGASLELGEQLVHIAETEGGTELKINAHQAAGISLFWLGEFNSSRIHLNRVWQLHQSQRHRPPDSRKYGADAVVASLSHKSVLELVTGYPERSMDWCKKSIALAEDLSSPFNIAFARTFAAWLYQMLQELELAKEQAKEAITISSEQGFPVTLAISTMIEGYCEYRFGEIEKSIGTIGKGMDIYAQTGSKLAYSQGIILISEAFSKIGQPEKSLGFLEEGIAQGEKTGDCVAKAELYRLKGQILLDCGRESVTEVEKCFSNAIEIARYQGAKFWELRSVLSLSRLWKSQGRYAEAKNALSEIYNWFTEGLDRKDLKEVRALIDELS